MSARASRMAQCFSALLPTTPRSSAEHHVESREVLDALDNHLVRQPSRFQTLGCEKQSPETHGQNGYIRPGICRLSAKCFRRRRAKPRKCRDDFPGSRNSTLMIRLVGGAYRTR